jgi:hypothetical protein
MVKMILLCRKVNSYYFVSQKFINLLDENVAESCAESLFNSFHTFIYNSLLEQHKDEEVAIKAQEPIFDHLADKLFYIKDELDKKQSLTEDKINNLFDHLYNETIFKPIYKMLLYPNVNKDFLASQINTQIKPLCELFSYGYNEFIINDLTVKHGFNKEYIPAIRKFMQDKSFPKLNQILSDSSVKYSNIIQAKITNPRTKTSSERRNSR